MKRRLDRITCLGVEAFNVDSKVLALIKDVIKVILVKSWAQERVAEHPWSKCLWVGVTFCRKSVRCFYEPLNKCVM